MSFPHTPMKSNLPGAYMQTPGQSTYQGPMLPNGLGNAQAQPAHSPLTRSLPPLPAPAPKPRPESLSVRQRAAKTVDETLAQEERYPDLDAYLSHGFSSDYDIPSLPSWAPFQKVKMYNIPDKIFEQYNRAQVATSMGLFAELDHAWIVIDNSLYLWDYTHPHPELIGLEGQPNSINAVKLVKPRPGVFLPSVTHLLVLSTTVEVMLIGLTCQPSGSSKMVELFSTGMSTSTRGLDVSVVASSASGRIFFGGSMDNDVYELKYQQHEGWFQGRCSKVNHTSKGLTALTSSFGLTAKAQEHVVQMLVDDSRNLLYTLSSTSSIRVFLMKADGSLNLIITKRAIDIYANIGHIISSNETLNPKVPIVSINPIPASEASRYHLVATTATGYRIYLSATSAYPWMSSSSNSNIPTSMQALHVKTPPSDIPSAPMAATAQSGYQASLVLRRPVHTLNPTRFARRFTPGYYFCFTSRDPRADAVFVSTPDSSRLARPHEVAVPVKPGEMATWIKLGSRVEDVGLCAPPAGTSHSGSGNELAVQFDDPAAEIAILTNTGIHIIRRRRLVDIFASLIRSAGGEEGLETHVKTLIRLYGRSETLATALAVACGQGIEVATDSRLARINDIEILDIARKIFIEFGGKPTFNENADATLSPIDAVVPSPRHAGIALYISRLLRSIWKTTIVKTGKGPGGAPTFAPSVSISKLQIVQRDLVALQNFLRQNKNFIEGLSGPEALSRVATKQEEIALQAEHRALHSLTSLINDTVEGISFVLVLFDEKVEEIVALLPQESNAHFVKMTFEELFSTAVGHNVAKDLVKAIVNRNIAKGSNVETVAEGLRRRCGSFCSADDVVIFKAQELLKRAAEAGGDSELGRNYLNDSLSLFEQVSESLPMDYLQSAVAQYIQHKFFAGAIQLCLAVAVASDKANRAMSWIMDGSPADDQRRASFEFRRQCYELIYDVIVAVDELSANDPGVVDGVFTVAARRKAEAYEVIAACKDEVFLTSLYDWYLERGLSDRLLEIKTPFVITYLERKSREDMSHADLLWKYYSQLGRFHEAAAVQMNLAQSPFGIPLNRRIEYLGQARANASVYSTDVSRAARQRLLQEISTLIDIANIQDDLLQRLRDDDRISPEQKEAVLLEVDNQILDLSTLFNVFADPGGYYDICLQIMYLANHRNAADIKTAWENLLQEVHTEASRDDSEYHPYEAAIETVRSLANKLQLSATMFPVPVLLPMLERYVVENQLGVGPPNWVVDLFLDLKIPHETLYTVLESIFYNDEVPFHGKNRRYIAHDLLYLIARWYEATVKVGGSVFGSEVVANRVSEMLILLQQSGLDENSVQLCRDIRENIAMTLQ